MSHSIDSMTPAQIRAWLKKRAEEVKLELRMNSLPQCDALILAGWKFELPAISDPEPWQWYWRRPPKGKAKKGRLFLSTNQAYQALMGDEKCSKIL